MSSHPIFYLITTSYIVLINLSAYIAFYFDKKLAQANERRISKSTLLSLAFFGGSGGAILAQQQFRHKTRKQPFKSHLYLIAVLHVGLVVIMMIPSARAELLNMLQAL